MSLSFLNPEIISQQINNLRIVALTDILKTLKDSWSSGNLLSRDLLGKMKMI